MATTSSVSSSSNVSATTIGGPLDVQGIVAAIIYADQQPVRDLQTTQTAVNTKIAAFQDLNTKVSALESAIYTLQSSGFSAKSVTSSDSTSLSALADSSAQVGNQTVIVRQLAQAQSNTSNTFTAASDFVGSGSFSMTQGAVSLNIADMTGKSLADLRNSINAAGFNALATIINFGPDDYRLQITSLQTGTANGFTIATTGNAQANLNIETAKNSAKDAWINVNSTAEGDKIIRSSNTISDVIGGVTLNLYKEDVGKPITISATNDSEALKKNISDFVTAFNNANDLLNTHFTYDEQKGSAGVLAGESAARQVQSNLLSLATSQVNGIADDDPDNGYNSFAAIGIKMNNSGDLQIDQTKLDNALANHLTAVQRVFKDMGTSSSADVTYITDTTDTQPGQYHVHYDASANQWSFRYNKDGTDYIESASLGQSGDIITGLEGDSKGLTVLIPATSDTGDKGIINFTRGIGERLRQQMYDISFPFSGLIANHIDTLNNQLTNIAGRITTINSNLDLEANRLVNEYSQANSAMVQMNQLLTQFSNL